MIHRTASSAEAASSSVTVGQVVELDIDDVAHGGWCVARIEAAGPAGAGGSGGPTGPAGPAGPAGAGESGGLVVFVRHALPGERVRALITQVTAKLARADAIEIVRAAPERVSPPCPYAVPGGCGGCDWQHASLPAQRDLKAQVVSQQLKRIAGIGRPVTVEALPGESLPGEHLPGESLPDETGLGWRTRVRFAVGKDGRAGLHKHRSHDIVPVSDCLIAHSLVREAEITRQSWRGSLSVDVAVAPRSGDRAILPALPAPAGARSARPAARPVDAAQSARTAPRYLTQHAAGRDWRVAATGFWQVHPAAADVLAEAVLDALRPQDGDTALDLFCGAGLFAGVLADSVGPDGTVIGIEHDAAAVRDARHNLRPTPWARVHRGDAAEVLARIGPLDVRLAVLDPPRTGAGRPLVDALCAEPALHRIAYVSCDPATLARDLALFAGQGWQLATLRAFDAFPMTHHIECLAVLTRPSSPPPADHGPAA